ncbi:MAG: exosortase/archaeosortase family protein [Verrucomicrobia bacterium]|nr:exosortase/archaeosortase family protein [Verrucomicrobiota bacterium]
MKPRDYAWWAALLGLALFIWLRDRSWMGTSEDTVPLLIAMPLAWWLGRPWNLRETSEFLHLPLVVLAAASLVLGSLLNITLLLALGWTASLWAWLRPRLDLGDRARVFGLMALPLMAFPWVALDGQPIGWWFRLSGAWFAEHFFRGFGFSVTREGTSMMVQGTPVTVDAACSGLKVLQSLLIAGTFLAYVQFARTALYWWNVVALVGVAWLANTARIVVITAAAMTWGQEFAMGVFHTWGGLLVLVLMFIICGVTFEVERRWLLNQSPAA